MYCTGQPIGQIGPTKFLLTSASSSNTRREYNDKFLLEQGCAKGSTIVLNENAFIDSNTWAKITPKLFWGYRKMNRHVEVDPDWWMLINFDGFSAHMA